MMTMVTPSKSMDAAMKREVTQRVGPVLARVEEDSDVVEPGTVDVPSPAAAGTGGGCGG